MKVHLTVGARNSPLSQAQVQEVLRELQHYHPHVTFEPHLLTSRGDKELSISLRTLGKTDFFTAEIDALLLSGGCRIAIHSAKDLPEPLPQGLQLIALTQGVDSSDALVLRPGERLDSLPPGSVIATSSERREEAVRVLRDDLCFIDIRGTVDQRLTKLETGEADGVVVAEAALIRLNLTHLTRVCLPGLTVPYQGQLAILAREGDQEIQALFACMDTRQHTLYLGLEPPLPQVGIQITHYPLIKIVPVLPTDAQIERAFHALNTYTHLLFTSKSAVRIFCDYLSYFGYSLGMIKGKRIISVGRATAAFLRQNGLEADLVAHEETAEGMVAALAEEPLQNATCFWPHSARARPVLVHFFNEHHISYRECILYDTEPHIVHPLPDLSQIDEVYFTSPSTVEAFLLAYGEFPSDKKLTTIGPVTEAHLHALRESGTIKLAT